MTRTLVALCAAALGILGAAAPVLAQTQIRVLLASAQDEAVVASPGGLVVRPSIAGAAPLLTPDVTTVIDVRPDTDGLVLAGSIRTQSDIVISPLAADPLTLDGQEYRGSIVVMRDAQGTLRVVNLVELEQYLFSVVGSEVGASTPAAALQAQAIVARTYAVSRLGSHEDLGFDVHAGEADQAYNGIAAESEAVVDAVEATRGVVMISGGHLVDAYYSSCDGGYTADGRELNDPEPYLQETRDPYCPFSPYMAWSADVPAASLLAALLQTGILPPTTLGALTGIRPGPADQSGRLQTVELVISHRTVSVPAPSFRAAAGNHLVKSTRIASLSLSSGIVHVTGSGYGHGVGMCQLGARGMAQSGLGVYAIINFYYPGVLLTQLASFQRYELARSSGRRLASRH